LLGRRTFKFKCVNKSSFLDQIVSKTGLEAQIITKLVSFGAVWRLNEKMNHIERIRTVDFALTPEFRVGIYFDPSVLKLELKEKPLLIAKEVGYEVWYKPSGWLSEGSPYGDFYSMERYASSEKVKFHAVNRLDREVEGLMILCSQPKKFHEIQKSWSQWIKVYQAEVLGQIQSCQIDAPLDGKEARTSVQLIQSSPSTSLVEILIETGRFHQIRRHLDMMGHPIIGDPRYGRKNKDPRGLQLRCVELRFKDKYFQIPKDRRLY